MLSKQFIYTANGLQSAFFSGTLNGVCVSRWNLPWRNTLLYIHNLWASLPLTNNFLNRAVFGCNLLWRNNDPFDGWYLLQWCVCEGLLKALLHCANVAPMFVSLCRLQQPQCIFFRNHTQEEKVRCWKIVCKWMIQLRSRQRFLVLSCCFCLQFLPLVWNFNFESFLWA